MTRNLWWASAGSLQETSLAPVEGWLPMRVTPIASGLFSFLLCAFGSGAESTFTPSVEKKQNNLVAELLRASSISEPSAEFTFTRATEGWVFLYASVTGTVS